MEPTIYIPNLDGSERLARLLASLRQQTVECDIVVVDNGSKDDSVAMTQCRFPDVTVVALPRNVGFGRAMNRAIAEQPGDPILLVNNDVECEPGFVEAMVGALRPEVEMVAGVLTQRWSPGLIDSAGVVADKRTLMAFDYLHGEPLAVAETAPPPLAPTGGAALYRRGAFDQVGGFDERIFAYYEDLDLALRLRNEGAGCALAPRARARHELSATLGSRSPEKYALTGWSRGYLLRRYAVLERPGRAARTAICELAVCAGQLALDRTAQGAIGRVRGWRDGGGLPKRPLPDDGLIERPLLESFSSRFRRRGASVEG